MWFLHARYAGNSYSTVGQLAKELQEEVNKAKAMLQRVKGRQNKKNNH